MDEATNADSSSKRKKWIGISKYDLSGVIGELSYCSNRCKENDLLEVVAAFLKGSRRGDSHSRDSFDSWFLYPMRPQAAQHGVPKFHKVIHKSRLLYNLLKVN